jgi:hypothetical protein
MCHVSGTSQAVIPNSTPKPVPPQHFPLLFLISCIDPVAKFRDAGINRRLSLALSRRTYSAH